MDVLIVEDHTSHRETLCRYVADVVPDARISCAPSGYEAAQTLAQMDRPGLILLDLSLPDGPGFCALRKLVQTARRARVAVLSEHVSLHIVDSCLHRGAHAVIPKAASAGIVTGILRLILAGGTYIPHELFTREPQPTTAPAPRAPGYGALTPRQREILALLGEGYTNKAIAARLGVREGTVKIHLTTIFKTLGVRNRTEAAASVPRVNAEEPAG